LINKEEEEVSVYDRQELNPVVDWLLHKYKDNNKVLLPSHWNYLLDNAWSYELMKNKNRILKYVLKIMAEENIPINRRFVNVSVLEYILELIKDNDTYNDWIKDTWVWIISKYNDNSEYETIKNKLRKLINPDLELVREIIRTDSRQKPRQFLQLVQQWIKKYDIEMNEMFLQFLVYQNDIEMIKWIFKEYPEIVPSEESIKVASTMISSENNYELLRLLLSHPGLRKKKSWWDRFTSWFS
jgi:hypothetical protein